MTDGSIVYRRRATRAVVGFVRGAYPQNAREVWVDWGGPVLVEEAVADLVEMLIGLPITLAAVR